MFTTCHGVQLEVSSSSGSYNIVNVIIRCSDVPICGSYCCYQNSNSLHLGEYTEKKLECRTVYIVVFYEYHKKGGAMVEWWSSISDTRPECEGLRFDSPLRY